MDNNENTNEYQEINPQLEVLWSVKQTAKYLGLHPVTIYQWVRKGKIQFKKFGKSVRIPKSEVERLVGLTQSKLSK